MTKLGLLWRQALRFLIVGGSNTILTFVLLAILAHFIDHSLAYTIVFALGVLYTISVTGRFVFSAAASARQNLMFLAWYLGVYVVGIGVIQLADYHHQRSGVTIALATVIVTAPLSFIGGRLIYHRATNDNSTEIGDHGASLRP